MEGKIECVVCFTLTNSPYADKFSILIFSAGVYFNDSTKAVLVPKGESFIYVERKKSLEVDGERTEQVPEVHSLSKFPDSLQKKVTLLKK